MSSSQTPMNTSQAVVPLSDTLIGTPLTPEMCRQVYISLNLPEALKPTVIGVTSAIRGEGRTTIALALAQTLAADLDTPVTLVEVDLQHPTLATHFTLPPAPGLCEVLRGECDLGDALRVVGENLSVITAGGVSGDADRLLHLFPIVDPLHNNSDLDGVVVLDLPPIINHSYAALAASAADAVVLVVRAAVTPYTVIREAISRLGDRPPQGVIFNDAQASITQRWLGRQY